MDLRKQKLGKHSRRALALFTPATQRAFGKAQLPNLREIIITSLVREVLFIVLQCGCKCTLRKQLAATAVSFARYSVGTCFLPHCAPFERCVSHVRSQCLQHLRQVSFGAKFATQTISSTAPPSGILYFRIVINETCRDAILCAFFS